MNPITENPPPVVQPVAPRRLPHKDVQDLLKSAETALSRLERARGRSDFDSAPLENEVRSTLQLLSGEFAGVLRDIQAGRIPGIVDAAFFVRQRASRLLLTDLAVAEPDFLSAARRVLETLKNWPEQFPSDPVCRPET